MGRTFGSLCSGIEAASVAFAHLGWKAAWLSEVDVPASQVLAYHYGATAPVFPLDPNEPGLKEKDRKQRLNAIKAASRAQWGDRLTNWGDMTAVRAMVMMGEAEAPEIVVAGTPCQGFSIAGLRGGLNDDRSNLALEYIRIVDAVDRRRQFNGEEPCVTLWENVPGVLSDKTNAFGCLLAGLAGEDVPLVPAGRKWSNAGLVLGPRRAVAWVVKDAQYFGLAQRRKRVFVVASARQGFDPGAILFEFDGVRRDSAPSRGSEKDLAASLTASLGGCSGKDGIEGRVVPEAVVGSDLTKGFRLVSFGEYVDDELASTMQSRDYKYVTDVVAQAYAIQAGALRTNPLSGPDGMGVQEDQAYTLEARADVQRVAYGFQPRIARNGRGDMGDVVSALTAEAGQTGKGDAAPHVAYTFPAEMSGTQFASEGDLAQALAVTHGQAICVTGDITHTLKAEGFDASEDGTGRGQPIVAVQISPTLRAGANKTGGDRPPGTDVDTADSLIPYALEVLPINTTQITSPENGSNPQWGDECFSLAAGNHPPAVALKSEGVIWAVRRLMPVECERLQGFPEISKRLTVTVCLGDKSQGPAHAETQCTTSQNSVSNAGENGSPGSAKSASSSFPPNHRDASKPAVLNVRIDSELGGVLVSSAGRLLWRARYAAPSASSHLQAKADDIARFVVQLLGVAEKETTGGKAASPLSEKNFSPHWNGEMFVNLFVEETEVDAKDAKSASTKSAKVITFTTSNSMPKSRNDASILTTSCCSALNAIASFIPPEILDQSSFSIEFENTFGYTKMLPGGKKAADGPRYRQLGNSWAVNNVRWIGNRIEAELRRGMLSKQIERRLKIEALL